MHRWLILLSLLVLPLLGYGNSILAKMPPNLDVASPPGFNTPVSPGKLAHYPPA